MGVGRNILKKVVRKKTRKPTKFHKRLQEPMACISKFAFYCFLYISEMEAGDIRTLVPYTDLIFVPQYRNVSSILIIILRNMALTLTAFFTTNFTTVLQQQTIEASRQIGVTLCESFDGYLVLSGPPMFDGNIQEGRR